MIEEIVDNSVHLVGTIVKPAMGWGRLWDTEFKDGLYLELCVKNANGKENTFAVYMPRECFNFNPFELTVGKEVVVDGFLNGTNGWHAVIATSIKPKRSLNTATNHFELVGTTDASLRNSVKNTRCNITNLDAQLKQQYHGMMIVGTKLSELLKEIKDEKIYIEGSIDSKMVWSKFKGRLYENLVSDFKLKTDVLKIL